MDLKQIWEKLSINLSIIYCWLFVLTIVLGIIIFIRIEERPDRLNYWTNDVSCPSPYQWDEGTDLNLCNYPSEKSARDFYKNYLVCNERKDGCLNIRECNLIRFNHQWEERDCELKEVYIDVTSYYNRNKWFPSECEDEKGLVQKRVFFRNNNPEDIKKVECLVLI